jgi:hypothetical protein
MSENDVGKTVLGEDWPLEERLVDKDRLIESYINCGRLSDTTKVGITLGQDGAFYYIAWYLLDEQKVVLYKSSKDLFDTKFPSEQDRHEMEKNLPPFPPQPIGLENSCLGKIVKDRNIVRF